MQKGLACLFPAFALKYTGKEVDLIRRSGLVDLETRITDSGRTLGLDIEDFDISENNYLDAELENQVLSYIFSCSFADVLRQKEGSPEMVSGFSMGIYAALYYAGAIDFRTGLFLVRDFYTTVRRILSGKNYLMASVVGFDRSELSRFSAEYGSVETVIQNGTHSFVLSGEVPEMEALMKSLQENGAIHISPFQLASPYHAKILRNHSADFEKIVNRYSIKEAALPVFSMIDLKRKQSAEELQKELVNNVSRPLNFYESIRAMNRHGINKFVEVGADKALLKSSKFIEGDFEFIAIARGKYQI